MPLITGSRIRMNGALFTSVFTTFDILDTRNYKDFNS